MTKSEEEKDFNIFVGAETGILKGIKIHSKGSICKNLHNLKSLNKQNEVTALSFGDSEQEILLGLRNQTVKIYDTKFKSFSTSVETPGGVGPLVGVCRHEDSLVTASQSGVLTYWKAEEEKKRAIDVIDEAVMKTGKLRNKGGDMTEEEKAKHILKLREGRQLCAMRQCAEAGSLVGLGGRETELEVRDLARPDSGPVFTAKNVPPDSLQLRVPVWVSDLCFLSPHTVTICSRHGHIRAYDLREGGPRRPVTQLTWPQDCGPVANSALCSLDPNRIAVGTSGGLLGLWDLRAGKGYGGLLRKYGGSVGAVTSVCRAGPDHLAAVGLDRFLKVWRVGKGGRKPVYKLYLKSRLNCILALNDFQPDKLEDEQHEAKEIVLDNSEDECMILDDEEEEEKTEEEDELWANMPVISGKRKSKDEKNTKKLKT